MTGDSDNEVGNAGEPPLPVDLPHTDGEHLYRPLRGWASAYQPEPSLWSRISSGFGRIFARRKKDEFVSDGDGDDQPLEVEGAQDELLVAHETTVEQIEDMNPIESIEHAETPGQELVFISEAVEEAEAVQEAVVGDADAPAEEDAAIPEAYHEAFDAAFDAPRSPVTFSATGELPPVREYQIRGGEDVSDIPVVREYQLHSREDEYPEEFPSEPRDIPARSLLDDEREAKKPGFFARLFGFGRRKEATRDPSVAEPALSAAEGLPEDDIDAVIPGAEPVISSEATDLQAEEEPRSGRLDRPSIEFFMRVDRASDETEHVPSLDDALPMDDAGDAIDAGDALDAPIAAEADVGQPTQPWMEAIPEPVEEKKPGFFARLFGRKNKTADLEFAFEPETAPAEPVQEFVSVEDALPVEDAAPAEPPAPEPVAAEPFFFDAPAPPAGFDQPIGDSRSAVELEPVVPVELDLDSTLETGPPAAATDSRSTVQVSPMGDEVTTGEMVPPVPPEVTAAMEADRPPFFVPKFRAFYNEIVSHKLQKAEFTAGFATAVMDYTADLSPDAAAQQLQKRLSEILELQAAEATWMGGEAASRFPDAQYAMAALADEVFTHIDWAGKEAWPRHLVEQRLFRSNARDVEFFRRVDRLLKKESGNPSAAAKDLARMYLLVLAAGFQGKYRPFGLTRPLAEYRRRLYEFVSGKDPLLIYSEERKLFPESAERVVVGRAVSRFSMLQQWAAVLILLIIGYAVISQMAWNRVSADLKDVTARVEAANSQATSDGLAGDPR